MIVEGRNYDSRSRIKKNGTTGKGMYGSPRNLLRLLSRMFMRGREGFYAPKFLLRKTGLSIFLAILASVSS